MSEQAKTLSAEPIYTYFFEDGTTCTIYKDCIKFETDGQCVIREPKSWHSLGWDDKPAYVNSGVGYKLVPQEPTLEMQMAGAQCGPGAENQGKLMDAWSVYRRMVQASPSISPSGEGKMNETKSMMIANLAADHEQKRAKFEAMGYRNVYGLTAKEREQSAIEYAIAEAEMLEAHSRLRGAIGSASSPSD